MRNLVRSERSTTVDISTNTPYVTALEGLRERAVVALDELITYLHEPDSELRGRTESSYCLTDLVGNIDAYFELSGAQSHYVGQEVQERELSEVRDIARAQLRTIEVEWVSSHDPDYREPFEEQH